MKLSEINWPVFRLGENKPLRDGSVLYYYTEFVSLDDSDVRKHKLRIVDDTEVEGSALGTRRLRLASLGCSLFKIPAAIYYLADLVKIAKSTTWFIDNSGKLFQYKKSTRAKLTYHKIQRILPGTGMGAVVEVEGLVQRFKCLYRPTETQKYVGILQYSLGYMLYGFFEEWHKPTYRLV